MTLQFIDILFRFSISLASGSKSIESNAQLFISRTIMLIMWIMYASVLH